MTKPLPETASFREFAELVPCKPGYVTHLRKSDRLVLTEDGRIKVRESLQRIEDTSDPSKIAVAARHAATRAANSSAAKASEGEGTDAARGAAVEPDGEAAAQAKDSSMYQHWRERGERAKALSAERENAIAEGKLMSAEDVLGAVRTHYATLRTGLESLADFLAPQIVGIKEEIKVRSLIADAIEQKLAELSRQFSAIAKEMA